MFLGFLLPLTSSAAVADPGAEAVFGFDQLAERARKLAADSYQKPAKVLPAALAGLTYDEYRDIRYRRGQSPWRSSGLPFDLAFFHQGRGFDTPVKIHEIADGAVREIRYDPAAFDYGSVKVDPANLKDLGFAGFRVHYPINQPQYKDEVVVFLGASYFRGIGREQIYGLSARGLAVDTAMASGEEFPRFTEFWIQRPAPEAQELVIYALLDSPRAAGAYRFTVKPGESTEVDVQARLFLRAQVGKLGLAPLTSMYFFGENQRSPAEDYRPEVHDSDGLSVATGSGEWLWRPLVNPRRLLVTSFSLTDPKGFGLMQRDRRFASYEDLEAHYERRPSAWVEPVGRWGAGRVELIQIPTPNEFNDNIVAFWVPDAQPRPGAPFDIAYRLLWQKTPAQRPPLAWVTQTRRGHHEHGGKPVDTNTVMLAVDFEGPALQRLDGAVKVDAMVNLDGNAKLIETNTYRNGITGGWRMTVKLRRVDDKKPVELRARLGMDNITLSETWSYIIPPE